MKKTLNKISEQFDRILLKLHLLKYKDIILFIIILVVLHFGYNIWNVNHNWPIKKVVNNLEHCLTKQVYIQSGQLLKLTGYNYGEYNDNNFFETQSLKGIDYGFNRTEFTYYFETGSFLHVIPACSGFKQLIITLLLFILFPGPWKKKLWFIPIALVLMYITNILRITILGIAYIEIPQYWDILHHDILRPGYYLVLFFIWVWWNEKYYRPTLKAKKS